MSTNQQLPNNQDKLSGSDIYRQVIEANPLSTILVDLDAPDTPIVFVNRAFERITGYTRDEVFGKNPRFLQNQDTQQHEVTILRDAVAAREPCTVVLRNYRKDGSLYWNEMHIDYIREADGSIRYALGMQNDVTERVLREENLSLHRATFEASGNQIAVIDRDFRFVLVNPLYCEHVHREPHDLMGQPINTITHGKDWHDIYEPRLKSCLDGERQHFEVTERVGEQTRHYHVTYSPIRNPTDDVMHIVISRRDITNLKHAEIELRHREQEFRTLVEHNLDFVQRLDREGRFLYANPALEAWFGRDVTGYTNEELGVSGENLARFAAVRDAVFETGDQQTITFNMDVNGETRFFLSVLTPEFNQHGEVETILGVARDVTEAKRAEIALRQREEEFRALAENSSDLISRRTLDGKHLYANPTLLKALGLSLDDVIGKINVDLGVRLDQAALLSAARKRVIQEKQFVNLDLTYPTSSGDYRYLNARLNPEFDADGNVVSVLSVVRDVTEAKRAEIALRQREEEFRALAENSSDFISRLERDGTHLYANPSLLDALGRSLEDVIGKRSADFGVSESLEAQFRAVRERVFEEKKTIPFEFSITNADGATTYYDERLHPEFDADGNVTSIVIVAHDVTDKKQTEIALRQREEEFRALAENSSDLISRLKRDSTHLYANPALLTALGHPWDVVIGRTNADLGVPADQSAAFDAAREQVFQEKAPVNLDFAYLIGDETHHINARLNPEFDANGNVISVLVVARDVTESKRAEEALRKREQDFRMLAENSSDAIMRMARDSTHLYANPVVLAAYGKTLDEVIGKTNAEIGIPEHMLAEFDAARERVFQEKMPVGYDFSYVIDGETHWFNSRLSPEFDAEGNVVSILSISRDVTESKRAEDALRRSERLLQEVGALARVGGWEVDLVSGYGTWTQITREIHELPGVGNIPVEAALNYYHPDDRETIIQALDRARTGGTPYDLELRLITHTGRQIWVRTIGKVEMRDGVPVRLYGAFQDITDRVAARDQAVDDALERERLNMLGRFVRNAAHEFRTPLSLINSSAYLMMRQTDIDRRQAKADQIQAQVSRMTQLLDVMLLMTRLDSGELHFEPVDLATLIHNAAQPMRTHTNVPVEIDHPQTLPTVMGDQILLENALVAIVDNARRFSPDGGIVRLTAEVSDQQVTIAVHDQGPGIPDEALPHIFKTFWRGDDAQTTEGLGLGLSMASKIVEAHHGQIEVNSSSHGSVFRVVLPIIHHEHETSAI